MKTRMTVGALLLGGVLVGGILVAGSGCGVGRVFYEDRPVTVAVLQRSPARDAGEFSDYRAPLAAEFGGVRLASYQETPPGGSGESDQSAQTSEDEDKKDAAGAKAPVRPYTAPGTQVQRMTLLALGISAFGTADASGQGKEVSESMMMLASSGQAPGRLGLTGTSSITDVAGVRLGLQQGFATGIGLADRDRNIFTARANPLSGSTGRCQDLISAGFFNRDRAACESHFANR
jgi:hypothetical protein